MSRLILDAVGREVIIPELPTRVISLCPSQTETLVALGIANRLVGITRFCVHPETTWKTVTRIGGTKTPNYEKIRGLNPDLIIAEKEENTQEIIHTLEKDFPVVVTNVESIEDSLTMITQLGNWIQAPEAGDKLSSKVKQALQQIETWPAMEVAYFIWKDPWMVAGHSTYINSVLQFMGLKNCFTSMPGRYPEISLAQLKYADPQIVFLSSEPYPFKEEHAIALKSILPEAYIIPVDGEMFSWYGVHQLEMPSYLNRLKEGLLG